MVHAGLTVSLDVKRLHRILATIVRGLYFKQSHHLLPANAIFQVAKLDVGAVTNFLKESGLKWSVPPMLSDVFACMYCPGPIDSCRSVWLLAFYDQVCFAVWTFKTIDEVTNAGGDEWDAVIVPPPA